MTETHRPTRPHMLDPELIDNALPLKAHHWFDNGNCQISSRRGVSLSYTMLSLVQ